MLATALAAVLERHLERARPIDLGLWSLRGLEVLDPELKAEATAGTLLLSAGGRVLAARPLPPQDPTAGILALSLAALHEAAWRASPVLRKAGARAMLKSGFEELFNHLDPYSRYLAPEEAATARGRRIGQVGLGLRLAAGRGEVVVLTTILPEGPAAAAGLRPGDRLVAVDGVAVSARELGAAAALLEGPVGEPVALSLRRAGRPLQVRLLRSLIPPESLQAEWRDDILWLRLDGFSNTTDRRLAAALETLRGPGRAQERAQERGQGRAQGGVQGVVLDLRGNRGGLLSQAVAVAGAFLPGGVVAETAGRHPDAARTYLASAVDLAAGLPLVVLVDGRTASAAEIVAAALGDRGRAVVVGSATMGKGLIQAVVPLPNGGELLVSWARVLAPRGWPIQGLGVLPAFCTALGAEVTAAEFDRATLGEAPMAAVLAQARAARAPLPAADAAALRGACPPAAGRDADEALARRLIGAPAAYAAALAR